MQEPAAEDERSNYTANPARQNVTGGEQRDGNRRHGYPDSAQLQCEACAAHEVVADGLSYVP
jgi:hypothetical protein